MNESRTDVKAPVLTIDTSYNPFAKSGVPSRPEGNAAGIRPKVPAGDWADLYGQLLSDRGEEHAVDNTLFPSEPSPEFEVGTAHFQYKGQYVVSTSSAGLMIVSQYRAHVRILYDRYMAQMARRENVSQGLLFPELLTLPSSDARILEDMLEDVRYLGFDVTSIGGGSFSINGLPADVGGLSPQILLQDMVDSVREGGTPGLADYKHRIALSLAKATAIVDGQFLSQEEMDVLMSDLLKSTNPNITPDGKTIIAVLTQENIDKMFV